MEIKKVAVIGSGILGTQIAIQSAHFGYDVTVYDSDPASFEKAHQDLKTVLSKAVGKPLFTPELWEEEAQKVRLCPDLTDALSEADLVIEAVPEDVEIKRKVFAEIDGLAPRGAILATNSSSIPVSKIESATTRPEQCLNLHFYFPAMGTTMVDHDGGCYGGHKDNSRHVRNRQGMGPFHRMHSADGQERDPGVLFQPGLEGDQTGDSAYVGGRICGFYGC
ncbi:MAG: NAD(P)-binding domain-containing protein [Deltaproteobacteria bacterium]|nr:NAD(P)-binding domain-containing protein [Deltaproteobacteria bacterium]